MTFSKMSMRFYVALFITSYFGFAWILHNQCFVELFCSHCDKHFGKIWQSTYPIALGRNPNLFLGPLTQYISVS